MEFLNTLSFIFMSLAVLAFSVMPIKYPKKLKKYLWLIVMIYLIGLVCAVFSAFLSSERITEVEQKNFKQSQKIENLLGEVKDLLMIDSVKTESIRNVYHELKQDTLINEESKDSVLRRIESLLPKDSIILGKTDSAVVTKGNLIKISVANYESTSSKCGENWICFIDKNRVWPQLKIWSPLNIRSVSLPSEFHNGKLVLACIQNEDTKRRFEKYLGNLNIGYLNKPLDFKIIFLNQK